MSKSLPCIVCRKSLEDAMDPPSQGNQPSAGLEFTTRGHYGSTVFDMEPGMLVVNVCDPCLVRASREEMVRHRRIVSHDPPRSIYEDEPWRYEE